MLVPTACPDRRGSAEPCHRWGRLVLPLTVKWLVDDLAQDQAVTEALVLLTVLALANAGIGALGSYVLDWAAESVVLDARRRLVSTGCGWVSRRWTAASPAT